MSEMQRATMATLVAVLISGGALLLEGLGIADPELRYPIVLLTKVLGAIIVIILTIRVALLVVKKKVLTMAPHAHSGLRNFGTVLFVTAVSLGGCAFGVSLMIDKSSSIAYWPLSIILIFGALSAYGLGYMWREWRIYRSFRGKK